MLKALKSSNSFPSLKEKKNSRLYYPKKEEQENWKKFELKTVLFFLYKLNEFGFKIPEQGSSSFDFQDKFSHAAIIIVFPNSYFLNSSILSLNFLGAHFHFEDFITYQTFQHNLGNKI